jgi:hypothetical protein
MGMEPGPNSTIGSCGVLAITASSSASRSSASSAAHRRAARDPADPSTPTTIRCGRCWPGCDVVSPPGPEFETAHRSPPRETSSLRQDPPRRGVPPPVTTTIGRPGGKLQVTAPGLAGSSGGRAEQPPARLPRPAVARVRSRRAARRRPPGRFPGGHRRPSRGLATHGRGGRLGSGRRPSDPWGRFPHVAAAQGRMILWMTSR